MNATLYRTRFGDIDIPEDTIVEMPEGLVGLPSRRWGVVSVGDGPFRWLQCLEDATLALPVCDPREFIEGLQIELADRDRERIGLSEGEEPIVWTTVRCTPEGEWLTNLRAPIVIVNCRGWQLINQAPDAALRMPLGLRAEQSVAS
jgi:flagellar assembly factor FliW